MSSAISGAPGTYDEHGFEAPFAEGFDNEAQSHDERLTEGFETPGVESPFSMALSDPEDLAWLDVEAPTGEEQEQEFPLSEDESFEPETLEVGWSGAASEHEGWRGGEEVESSEQAYEQEQEAGTRLPTPVDFRESEALELNGFPEYIADVSPEQRKAIDALAERIARSNVTNDPIFAFRVEGFADIARRIPNPNERKWFEDNISRERAQNAFDLLIDALVRKGGRDLADRIKKRSRAFGLGSQRLKVPNASTEAQFRRNRRVVFILRQVTFIPPPPPPPSPPTSVVEDRFSVQLLRAATLTVSPAPGVESFSVALDLQIVDHMEKKRALFKVTATGGGLGAGPGKGGGSLTFTPGPVVKFKTFRLLGKGAPVVNLKSFEGRISVFVDPGGGAGPATRGATLSLSFEGLEANGANTQPKVIRVPGGSSSVMTPGFSAGAVAIGYLRMVGAPVVDQETQSFESDSEAEQEWQAQEWQTQEWQESESGNAIAEYEQPARKRSKHPQDDVKSDIWSIAFLSSVGAGKKVGGAIAVFDLFNRTTNRAHRMTISALGKASGLPVELSFRDSGYVKFKTREPVTFADFHNRLAKLTLKDRVGKSWRSVIIYQVNKTKELMRVSVNNWNLTGWHGFSGWGRTEVYFGNGKPAGNPDYELRLELPVKEDVPVGFKVTQQDFGLVIRAPGDVLFDFDTDWLHYEADERLSNMIRYINALPTDYARIAVEGHTDSRERKPGYNLALSKRRARTVLNYFIRNKWAFNKDFAFDAPRGFGATRPVAPNKQPDGSDNPEGREKNRRVEVFLYKK